MDLSIDNSDSIFNKIVVSFVLTKEARICQKD